MKLFFTVLTMISYFSLAHAQTNTFDSEKPVYTETKTFRAIYKGAALMAWSPDENDDLSKEQLLQLAKQRSSEFCQAFGYQSGTYPENSVSMNKVLRENDGRILNTDEKGAYMVVNKKLVYTTRLNQWGGPVVYLPFGLGVMANDQARIFTQLTCFR